MGWGVGCSAAKGGGESVPRNVAVGLISSESGMVLASWRYWIGLDCIFRDLEEIRLS